MVEHVNDKHTIYLSQHQRDKRLEENITDKLVITAIKDKIKRPGVTESYQTLFEIL